MLAMAEPTNPSFDAETSLLKAKFSLSPLEAKFLHILLLRQDASKHDLPELSYSVRQVIYTLRKKLERIGGVYIVADGGGRYSIPKVSKKLIRAELGEHL